MATRKRSGGWLAWWAAPVGSGSGGRSRSRGRSGHRCNTFCWLNGHQGARSRGASGSGGPGTLAWWLASPGPKPSAPDGRGTAPPRERVRGSKGTCGLCGKGAGCRCRMVKGDPIKRRRRPTGSAPYAYPPDFRAQGQVWCGNCRHRINPHTGHCLNRACPR